MVRVTEEQFERLMNGRRITKAGKLKQRILLSLDNGTILFIDYGPNDLEVKFLSQG